MNNYKVSDIEDPRYLTQILLDFLDGFASPAIEQSFVNAIHAKLNETPITNFNKDIKDQLFKHFNKKEFFLLECFARFFTGIFLRHDNINEQIVKSVLRVCISLLSARKKLDKLFLKRSLLGNYDDEEDQVTHLKVFLLKWIENFNESFTETFIIQKSVLKLDEKKVTENLMKKVRGVNSVLNKSLGDQETTIDVTSLNYSYSLQGIIEETEDLPSGSNTLKDKFEIMNIQDKMIKNPAIIPPSNKAISNKINRAATVKLPKLNNRNKDIKSNRLPSIHSNNMSNRGLKSFTVPPQIMKQQSFKSETLGSSPSPIKSFNRFLTLSPPSSNIHTFKSPPKKSFFVASVNHSFQESALPSARCDNHRRYDTFFGQGDMTSLENFQVASPKVLHQEEYAVEELMERINSLTIEKQDMIFKGLMALQERRNLMEANVPEKNR